MTYDGDAPNTDKKWFKIIQWAKCDDLANKIQTITLPSFLPSSRHAVIRWEMYALHLKGQGIVEYYAACTDVRVQGTGTVLPTPSYNIPGHLPIAASEYRDYGETFITGPPVATIGGAPYTAPGTMPAETTSTKAATTATVANPTTSQSTSSSNQATSQPMTSTSGVGNCLIECQRMCGTREILDCSCVGGFSARCGTEDVSGASLLAVGTLSLAALLF